MSLNGMTVPGVFGAGCCCSPSIFGRIFPSVSCFTHSASGSFHFKRQLRFGPQPFRSRAALAGSTGWRRMPSPCPPGGHRAAIMVAGLLGAGVQRRRGKTGSCFIGPVMRWCAHPRPMSVAANTVSSTYIYVHCRRHLHSRSSLSAVWGPGLMAGPLYPPLRFLIEPVS
jgi:hypothetical protein